MTLVLSVPTDPNDATKKIDITVDPSNKNITVKGKCPKTSKPGRNVVRFSIYGISKTLNPRAGVFKFSSFGFSRLQEI